MSSSALSVKGGITVLIYIIQAYLIVSAVVGVIALTYKGLSWLDTPEDDYYRRY